jgi:hypothetical protein
MYAESLAEIERSEGSGLEKVQELIRAYARVVTKDFGMCVARLDDRELPANTRAEVRLAKNRYENAFRQEIARGVADGSIRACDPKLVTFVITGALNGIGMWYRPDGPLSAETIAEEFANSLTQGLQRGAATAESKPAKKAPRRGAAAKR